PARIAAEGAAIERGRVLIAPGNAHLGCIRSGNSVRATLLTHDVASRCRPSVDPMFDGVAGAYGVNAVGVVLSGMGRDGLEGAEALARAGGTVMVQDAASSAVWGMPGSVARAGFASLVATPQRLASAIARRGVA
ncbi:MAG: chemotaxis protein CheB, partial [Sphingomonadaceae bacterium]|nr:chemotaxis protein CheB [Sphingomonadaceae bacterium]